MGNWDIDLSDGLKGEEHVLNVLKNAEVKTDFKVGSTGNLAVEVRREKGNGEILLTGLSSSDGNYWIFNFNSPEYNQEVMVCIKTDRLKKIVKKHWDNSRIVWGGDDGRSQNILLKKELLLDADV